MFQYVFTNKYLYSIAPCRGFIMSGDNSVGKAPLLFELLSCQVKPG